MANEAKLFLKVTAQARDQSRHEGLYSLGLEIKDAHVDMRTHPYTHKPGNLINVTLFDLSADAIKDIGYAIIRESIKLEEAHHEM